MTTKDPRSGNGPPLLGTRRSARSQLAGLGITILTVLVSATACSGNNDDDKSRSTGSPTTSAASTPTTAPTTPSPKQAASEAALETYRQYIDVIGQVSRRGGKNPETLEGVAISDALTTQQTNASTLSNNDWHGVGATRIISSTVKSVNLKSDSKTFTVPEVILNTCIDATKAYAVDKTGKSVRPATAPTLYRWKVWVRYYPDKGGVQGWFVARTRGKGVDKC